MIRDTRKMGMSDSMTIDINMKQFYEKLDSVELLLAAIRDQTRGWRAPLEPKSKEVKKWKAPVGLNVKFTGHDAPEEYLIGLHKHLEKQSILYQLAHELNDGWEPDWNDSDQARRQPYYDHHQKSWWYNQFYDAAYPCPCLKPEIADRYCAMLNNGEVEGL